MAHIVGHYHRRLRAWLPHLVDMARAVEIRHRDGAAYPLGLTALLERLQESVLEHLEREEVILFPLIVQRKAGLAALVAVSQNEHELHSGDLLRVRALTSDLTPPLDACTTWRALYVALRQFEQDWTEHVRLENDILFPRALAE